MFAGFLAGLVIKGKSSGYVVNLVVGVIGAIFGGWLFDSMEKILPQDCGWGFMVLELFS